MTFKKQEKKTAEEMGGKRVPLSGSAWQAKGDVSTPHVLVECKTTGKQSYSMKLTTLAKIRGEANRSGKNFALQVQLADDPRHRFAVIDWQWFVSLLEGVR